MSRHVSLHGLLFILQRPREDQAEGRKRGLGAPPAWPVRDVQGDCTEGGSSFSFQSFLKLY